MKRIICAALMLGLFACAGCSKNNAAPENQVPAAKAAEAPAADAAKAAEAPAADAAKAAEAPAADAAKAAEAPAADAAAQAKAVEDAAAAAKTAEEEAAAAVEANLKADLYLAFKHKPEGTVIKEDAEGNGRHAVYLMDGIYTLGISKEESLVPDVDMISRAVRKWDGEPYNIKVESYQAKEGEQGFVYTSYPTWKITYLTGHNEDTRSNQDYLVQMEGYDYRLHTSVSADAEDEYAEAISRWISDVELVSK